MASGADVKAQVMEAHEVACGCAEPGRLDVCVGATIGKAWAALAPCVVLSLEEAAQVKDAIPYPRLRRADIIIADHALALLGFPPEGAFTYSDDIDLQPDPGQVPLVVLDIDAAEFVWETLRNLAANRTVSPDDVDRVLALLAPKEAPDA